MGMILSLSILWVFVSFMHSGKKSTEQRKLSAAKALQKIDTPSILFFLGILLAVSALQSLGVLRDVATFLDNNLGDIYLTGIALGLVSALLDNVPLVAAAQAMYSVDLYPMDHNFWHFLALTSGTGGSAIIIGSAAGVAAMGVNNVDFIWYLKKIAWIALVGFAAGIAVYLIQEGVLF